MSEMTPRLSLEQQSLLDRVNKTLSELGRLPPPEVITTEHPTQCPNWKYENCLRRIRDAREVLLGEKLNSSGLVLPMTLYEANVELLREMGYKLT